MAASTHRMGARVSTEPCPFCAIAAGRAPATILREWPSALAIVPLDPATDGHALIIARAHLPRPEMNRDIAGAPLRCALAYAEESGRDYNLIVNVGTDAGQTVPHLHWHYLPRRLGDMVTMPWPHPTGQGGPDA